jgi:hypothetical protein
MYHSLKYSSLTNKSMHDRKVAALVGTVGVGVQALLFIDYDLPLLADEPHVLVPVQTYFREWMRRNVYGVPTTTTSRSANEAALRPTRDER